jgi:dolichol-phosphate mannosyltransferase
MIYFIIPAYNEAPNLPELLSSLAKWARRHMEECHVIAVDDGSTDATSEILQAFTNFPLTLIQHRPNRGVAAVFQSGFQRWREFHSQPQDLVVTLEADNTSSLEILHTMVEKARSGHDVVLASCYSPNGEVVGTNLLRTTLSFCANLILRCTPGMPKVYTFSSFYRVHRGPFLNHAFTAYEDRMIEEEGYVCVVEMLLKFGLMGARICEVPLRLDGSKRIGPSKMKVLRTIRGYLQLFLHATSGSLARPKSSAGGIVAYKKAAGGR